MAAILYALSSVFFTAATVQVLRLNEAVRKRSGHWIAAAAASLLLALMNGLLAVDSFGRGNIVSTEISISLVSLVASIAFFSLLRRTLPQLNDLLTSYNYQQKQASLYRLLFEYLPVPVFFREASGRLQAANPAMQDIIQQENLASQDGDPVSSLLGTLGEDLTDLQDGQTIERYVMLQQEGRQTQLELIHTQVAGPESDLSGVLVLARDRSGMREIEAGLVKQQSRFNVLQTAALALLNQPGLSALQESLLDWSVQLSGTQHACLFLAENGQAELKARAVRGAFKPLEALKVLPGQDLPGQVWQTGQTLVVQDYPNWQGRTSLLSDLGIRAAAGLPVISNSQVLGVLLLAHLSPEARFQDDELEVLETLVLVGASAVFTALKTVSMQENLDAAQQSFENVRFHSRIELLAGSLAAHFIAIPSDKVEQAVQHALQTLGRFAGADRCAVHQFAREGRSEVLQEWCANGVSSHGDAMQELVKEDLPWWMSPLSRMEAIHLSDFRSVPPHTGDMAAYLASLDIVSYTAYPLISGRSLAGYLTIQTVHAPAVWKEEIFPALKILAEMFTNTFERMDEVIELRREAGKLSATITSMDRTGREGNVIYEMSDLLQACRTTDEAYPIVARYTARLIHGSTGSLYLVRRPGDPAEYKAGWGDVHGEVNTKEIAQGDCWALRRGRIHLVKDPLTEPICGHIGEPHPGAYLCAPLTAHGELVGLLHLRDGQIAGSSGAVRLAGQLSEQVALALANLTLKDKLRSQAIRDPLTGLFNRRYMEETLERELRRATRHGSTVGILMFDVDGLKPVNDRFGHDAGDVLLRSLGDLMVRMFRGEDVPCRYGGDEFTIILPEASLAGLWSRAHQLRDSFKKITLEYEGRPFGPSTISIGISIFPDHGSSAERLIQLADAAAYQAKSDGGDRVMIARPNEE